MLAVAQIDFADTDGRAAAAAADVATNWLLVIRDKAQHDVGRRANMERPTGN